MTTNPKIIELIRVEDSSKLSPEFREIYEEAFPPDERREWIQVTELLHNSKFNLKGIYHQQKLIGMLSIWNLNEFWFIEHFAIQATERGKGIGNQVIRKFLGESQKPVILEVEEPHTAMAQKRMAFYVGLNFTACEEEYEQPPYSNTKNKVKMRLMSYPEKIKTGQFNRIREEIYSSVYGINKLLDSN